MASEREGTIVVLDPADVPSVVPTLAPDLAASIEALIEFDDDLNKWFPKLGISPALNDIAQTLCLGKNKSRVRNNPWGKLKNGKRIGPRAEQKRQDDVEIARAYEAAELECIARNETVVPTNLKWEVGKRYGMSRSGSNEKIDRGLKFIEERKNAQSVASGIPDKFHGKVKS
jgi:hypothetical protein